MDEWLSTEQVAREIGMSAVWVRKQIEFGRMRAVSFETGRRSTFRIRRSWVAEFLATYCRETGAGSPPGNEAARQGRE